MPRVVGFYRTTEPYGCFSNFYMSDFTVNGVEYCCSEQYIMHQKALLFKDGVQAFLIMREYSPSRIKGLGRQVRWFNEGVWTAKVYDLTLVGLQAKFEQNPGIQRVLLSTEECILAECAPSDTIWGIGLPLGHPDVQYPNRWRGKNMLGRLLMDVRSKIREASYAQ